MAKLRYVVRLHKTMRKQLDVFAKNKGYFTPAFVSEILETELDKGENIPYKIFDEDEIFQLKAGGMEKGKTPVADKQMSVYLTEESYSEIKKIVEYLKQEVNKSIGPAYVIRDILYKWICEN